MKKCTKCCEKTGKLHDEECLENYLREEKLKIKRFIEKNPKYKKHLKKIYKKLLNIS